MQGLLKHVRPGAEAIDVRPAQLADRAAIHQLTENHHRVHFNLDWWSFDQWLHADRPSEAIWLAFDREELIGLLVAPFEQSPVVWLRSIAIGHGYPASPIFTALLAHTRLTLLAQGVERVALMAHPDWVDDLTQRLSFTQYNEVVTMRKSDRVVPDLARSAAAKIRLAAPHDVPMIAENDRAAFDVVWWHSAASLEHILQTVSHFVVAEIGDRVVGHAFSDVYGGHGHLIRLVVHPAYQGRGIGAQLLSESLKYQSEAGAYPFTLNTQVDNVASQALYRRYGYQLTGRPVRVMQSAVNNDGRVVSM
jgi:[ribosomal protein S18]-alanine N-acetyltransferase